MAWNRKYSVISYVRSSLWIVPILAMTAGFVLKRIAECVGAWLVDHHAYDLKSGFFAVNAEEAHSILERIFTLNLSCLVFSFGPMHGSHAGRGWTIHTSHHCDYSPAG